MCSWRCCPLEDDAEACGRSSPSPHRPLKRRWCTLDIDDGCPHAQLPPTSARAFAHPLRGRKPWSILDIDEEHTVPGPGSAQVHEGASSSRQRQCQWRRPDPQDHPVPDTVRHNWRQPQLEDHPVPEAPSAKVKEVTFSASTLAFLSNLPTKKNLNAYDKNGMHPERIRAVLHRCKCKSNCVRQFSFEEIHQLCRVYHSMHESDRRFMLHTMYTNEAASQVQGPSIGPKARQKWYILGHRVCVNGFVTLLGISERKLYKDIRLGIDGRCALDEDGSIRQSCRLTPHMDICHHFFRKLYTSAAEVLPTGQPRTNSGDDSSEDEQDNLDGWTPDRLQVELVGDSLGEIDPANLPVRQLPLFSMADLYWQFKAWFESEVLQGADAREDDYPEEVSDAEEPRDDVPNAHGRLRIPSRWTFSRTWYGSWSKVLRLKFPSDHSCCQTCFELREATYRTWAPLAEKLQYARRWRDHLRDQYTDRVLYWNLRFLSRRFDSTVLVIIIDSMDRKKAP